MSNLFKELKAIENEFNSIINVPAHMTDAALGKWFREQGSQELRKAVVKLNNTVHKNYKL